MNDPERLLTSTGDDFERELLGSLRGGAPPAGAKDEAWQKIGSQIAAVAMIGSTVGSVPPNAGGTGLVTALAKASVTKIALAIAATAVVLGGGVVVARHRASPPPVSITTTVDPAADRAAALEPAPVLTVPPVVVVSPSRGAAPTPRASADGTASARLAAESALLTAARAELVSGDPRAAQSTLTRMQTEFPHGVLSQEREVLAIEALAADGKADAAARRARAFIAAHPESPHSAQLGRFVEGP
jgi:hypothetical protein